MSDEGKQVHTIPAAVYPLLDQPWMNADRQRSIGDTGRRPGWHTILVVDDDPAVRRLTATILKSQGYGVIEAGSGMDGLKCFADHHNTVDLVLSDVLMPNMTGTEMIERILAVDPSVPVMLMTGWAKDSALPEGVPVLSKPFTPGALLQALQACLHTDAPALITI